MTDAFRQKLLNWFCSIGIILIASLLMPLRYWFVTIPEYQPDELTDIAGPFGETFLYYIFLAPIAIVWHLADFAERKSPTRRFAKLATLHSPFLVTVCVGIFLYSLMLLGVMEYNSCDELPDALHWECIARSSGWLAFPWLGTLVLAFALTLFKAVTSVWSQVKKPE